MYMYIGLYMCMYNECQERESEKWATRFRAEKHPLSVSFSLSHSDRDIAIGKQTMKRHYQRSIDYTSFLHR